MRGNTRALRQLLADVTEPRPAGPAGDRAPSMSRGVGESELAEVQRLL